MGLRQDVSHSWRSLRRAPLFSASVILTLTVGIGSAAAIFAVVNAVLIRPLPYGHPDQLFGAWHDMAPISLMHGQQTQGTYFTYKRFARTIKGIGVYQGGSVSVADPDGRADPVRMPQASMTANVVPLLEVQPLIGRTFTDAEDAPKGPNVAMISERLWHSRYNGDKNVIGKVLVVGSDRTEIIGVMPSRFQFPSADVDLWLPMQLDPNTQFPGGFNYNAVVRLKPGVTIEAAQRDFASVLPRVTEVAPTLAPGVTFQMVLDQAKPVPVITPMRDDIVGPVSRTLWMVAATAVLVLLVTCANVANLLLVRSDGRHRELSVRAALGAGRGRVIAHFFVESALLASVSAILGIGVAWIGIRILVQAGPVELPRLGEVRVDAAVIVFTVVVAALVAVACSAIPAIRFMRGDALSGLRDGGRGGTVGAARQRARGTLVAAQVAFALVVLASSGLLLRSFERLRAVKPGFNADGVATLWLTVPSQRYKGDTAVVRFSSQLAQRIAQIPGIDRVGLTSRIPLAGNGMNSDPFYVQGDATTANKIPPLEIFATIDSGYFGAMGIPLIAGRNFESIDRQQSDEAIISLETAITFFHDSTGKAALNRKFRELPGSSWHTIIGVVGSTRDTSLSSSQTRNAYYPQVPIADSLSFQVKRTLAVVAKTRGDVGAMTRAMQRVIHDIDPTLPTFGVRSVRATVDASMARLTFTMIILAIAAGVTLLLAVIGLYGVIAYIVTLRTRELGVRIALGAQPSSVAVMVTTQGLVLCVAGIVAGLVLVAAMGRFLQSLLFEVAPTDAVTLGASAGLLLAFALLASWVPARRASRVNPIEALRAD